MNYPTAKPTMLSRADIFKIAEEIGSILQYQVGEDLHPIVKKLGGNINKQDFNKWLEGDEASIEVRGERDFDIYIPSIAGAYRNRFTIAHELGHYILHSKLGKEQIVVKRFLDSSQNDRTEWEANWFAAGFLMPEKKFREAVEKSSETFHLSSIFGVSPTAIAIRKKELQI